MPTITLGTFNRKSKQTCKYFIKHQSDYISEHICNVFPLVFLLPAFFFPNSECSLEADINTQSHIYVFVMINSSHLPQAPHMNAKKYFTEKAPHTRRHRRKKGANICKDASSDAPWSGEVGIVYWFGISHDFCYFLKCSDLFNYHNILCVYFFPSSRLPSPQNLFLCFS